ncbi:hypothetical protein GJU40_07195 [Bacillus lacus]|uniref:JAB domain-containing protein n=1 Tax=Metabacillus lacus TaxID=1983721 RepID=A0A7X2IY49_9BACI|nr:Mov34/MPN/PAD-1 family protein [Metabacillus lacus]MRX71957.1 hypothetical protein [Metabacillus lacus]
MNFRIDSDGLLKISEKALSVLQQYRQVGSRDKEAGGVLLGRYIQSSRDIVVDLVTHPMKHDIRKRYFFKKCREDHQNIVQTLWEESDGTCNYLGEWHSHPETFPSPSSHDIKEWKKVIEHTICDSDKLFFIIVGTKSIDVWVGCRTSLEIKKMIRC